MAQPPEEERSGGTRSHLHRKGKGQGEREGASRVLWAQDQARLGATPQAPSHCFHPTCRSEGQNCGPGVLDNGLMVRAKSQRTYWAEFDEKGAQQCLPNIVGGHDPPAAETARGCTLRAALLSRWLLHLLPHLLLPLLPLHQLIPPVVHHVHQGHEHAHTHTAARGSVGEGARVHHLGSWAGVGQV